VETLESRWSPGSILTGELSALPWLGSLFLDPDAGAWVSDQASQVSIADRQMVSVQPSVIGSAIASDGARAEATSSGIGTGLTAGQTDDTDDALFDSVRALPDDPQVHAAPLPIPGGVSNPFGGPFIHHNFPGPADAPPPFGNEPSTITDLNGDIGVALVRGTGTDGNGTTLYFEADMRFMQGHYLDLNGALHDGAFGFL
jgi:hypothetical protein